MTTSEPSAGISRRRLLAGGLAAGAGLAVSGVGGFALGRASDALDPQTQLVPYYGPHQAGIATAAQERLQFAAFDILTDRRDDLRDLLKTWTAAAVAMTAGNPLGDPGGAPLRPPADTGEAVGLGAARLTTTIGFGPSMFGKPGHDRFGFASVRPAALADLPPFAHDELDPASSDGDMCVQACAEDPRLRSTRFVTWPGSTEGSSQSAGPSWVSAEPPAPRPSR
jgi:deferrochelatase/peroxidase EfeB